MRDLLAALWSFSGIDLDCVARSGMSIYVEGELLPGAGRANAGKQFM